MNGNVCRFSVQILSCQLLVETVVFTAFVWNEITEVKPLTALPDEPTARQFLCVQGPLRLCPYNTAWGGQHVVVTVVAQACVCVSPA